jgi:hypothetical protein
MICAAHMTVSFSTIGSDIASIGPFAIGSLLVRHRPGWAAASGESMR